MSQYTEKDDEEETLTRLETVVQREREDPDDPEQLLLIDRETVNVGLENAITTVELDELDEGPEDFGEEGQLLPSTVSFTAKQAKKHVGEVAVGDEKAMTKKGKAKRASLMGAGMSRMQIFIRHRLNDVSLGRVRSTLYLKSGDDDWIRCQSSESAEFSVFRIGVSALAVNTVRILFSAKDDNDEWHTVGYVNELLRKILMSEDSVMSKSIRSVHDAKHIGNVIIASEEMNSPPYNVKMAFGIQGRRVPVGFSQFLRVERLVNGMGMTTVYVSPLPRSQDQWEPFRLPLRKVCNGDVDLPITVTIIQRSNTGVAASTPEKVIGVLHTTVATLERTQRQTAPLTKDGLSTGQELIVMACVLQKFAASSSQKKGRNLNKFTNKLDIGKRFALKTVQKEVGRTKCPDLIRAGTQSEARFQRIVARQATIREKAGRGPLGFLVYRLYTFSQTQPLTRSLRRLPIARTVVAISRTFGASTSAFFGFSAWLVLVNFFMSAVWMGFVIVPKGLQDDGPGGVGYDAVDTVKAAFGLRKGSDVTTAVWTWYSDYTGTKAKDMAYYYTWATLATLVLNLLMLMIEMRSTYRRVEFKDYMLALNTDSNKYKYAFQLFGQWDHHITTMKGNEVQAQGIIVTLKQYLRDTELATERSKVASLDYCSRKTLQVKRAFCMLMSIALGVGSIWGIVYTTNHPEKFENLGIGVMDSYVQPVVLTAINTIIYPIISLLVKQEKYYSEEAESSQIIIRSFFIKISNIFAIYYNLRFESNWSKSLAQYNNVCVQDLIGNTFLALYVSEVATDMANCVFWPLISKYRGKKHHFNVPTNVISMVFRQMIVWMGTTFCPALPPVAFVLGFVGFNWKATALRWLSSPDEKPWNASRAQLFFMQIGAIAMFAAMAPIVHFLMTDFSTEGAYFACGPHLEGGDVINFMWADNTPDGVKEVVEVLVSPVFLIILNVILVIVVVLLLQIILGASSEMKTMSAELEEEHFDKLKLLANVGIVDLGVTEEEKDQDDDRL